MAKNGTSCQHQVSKLRCKSSSLNWTLNWPQPWLTSWLQPHKKFCLLVTQFIQSQIAEPQKLSGTECSLLLKAATFGHSFGASGKEPICQCRRHKRLRFEPWVRKILWRRTWQPTPVFMPREFHRQRSLAGNSTWGHKEADTAEVT